MDTEDNNFSEKTPENSTEKCRALLANLLDLSKNESKRVKSKVRKLTQGLINAEVEPEEYCTNLERMLNASHQSSLIPFLQKTLPMLRLALVSRELVIEGIVAPAPQAHVSTTACSSVQDADFTNMASNQQKIESERLQKKPVLKRVYPGKVCTTKGGKKIDKIKRLDMPSCSFSADIPLGQSLEDKQPSSPPAAVHVLGKISVDDDINDVVTMAGVDVAEESQQFTPSTKKIERVLESPYDSGFINLRAVEARVKLISERYGLTDYLPEVALYLKYAAEDRIRDIVEKVIKVAVDRHAQSRMMQNGCVITSNVKVQLSFLRDIEEIQKKRAKAEAEGGARAVHPDTEEDEMFVPELENRQVETNETVAQAIGGRNRQAQAPGASDAGGSTEAGPSTSAQADEDCNDVVVRVTIRDMIFVLEQDEYYCRSQFLCILKMYAN